MTSSQEIIRFLKSRYPEQVHKGSIFGELSDLNIMPDTISRCLRKMAETGKIERIKAGKSVAYRYIISEDGDLQELTRDAFKQADTDKQSSLL